MIFALIILLFVVFNSAQIAPEGQFMTDYISKEKTTAVKGIFVVLVVFRHFSGYVHLDGIWDKPFLAVDSHLHQAIVAMFLFYSGYGMITSIMKKGFNYVKGIPVKRFFRTWLNFAMALSLFCMLNLFLGVKHDLQTILLAFIGYTSIGNSSWYMFAVFALYWITFVSFLHLKWHNGKLNNYLGMILLTLISVGFVFLEMKLGLPKWYYNTVIVFALGGWYALLKEKIERIVMKSDYTYALALVLTIVIYIVSFQNRSKYGIEGYSVWIIAFTVLVTLITMKVSFSNPLLIWLGNHVFSIYILQRIPMIVFKHYGWINVHQCACLVLTLVVTALMAMVFDYITAKLIKKLLPNRPTTAE